MSTPYQTVTIIWILILLTLVNGLPRIPYDSEENVETPSTSDEQRVLRKIFRNSQEMDQTGFHAELEAENRNFLDVGTSAGNTLESVPTAEVLIPATPHASLDDSDGTSVIGGIADTTAPHGNNNGDMLDKQIQLDPILIEEHEKPAEMKSELAVFQEAGKMENENEKMSDVSESDVNGIVSGGAEKQEKSAVEIGKSNPTDSHEAHHLGIPIDLIPTPHVMNPPPFLVTQPLFGQNYVYQLRYPKPQHQPIIIAGKEYPPTEEAEFTGLNAKNVYGPPLPIDLIKLHMKSAMEQVEAGISSLPFDIPVPEVSEGQTSSAAPTPNIFMFFKSCALHSRPI